MSGNAPSPDVWDLSFSLVPAGLALKPSVQEAKEELRVAGQDSTLGKSGRFGEEVKSLPGPLFPFQSFPFGFFVKTMETQGGVSSSSCYAPLKRGGLAEEGGQGWFWKVGPAQAGQRRVFTACLLVAWLSRWPCVPIVWCSACRGFCPLWT